MKNYSKCTPTQLATDSINFNNNYNDNNDDDSLL